MSRATSNTPAIERSSSRLARPGAGRPGARDSPLIAARNFITSDPWNSAQLLIVLVVAAIGFELVVLRTLYLPRRFYLDAIQIQQIAIGRLSAKGDESFANVAGVYRFLGLQYDATLAGTLGYGAFLAVMSIVIVLGRARFTWFATASIVISIVLAAVYLGTYSKDVFVLPVVALVLCLRRGLVGEVIALAGVVAYAELFRTYWYLVAALFIAFRVLVLLTRRRWVLVPAPILALVALAVVMPLVTGHSSDYARTFVNESRSGTAVSTLIAPFVAWPEPLGSMVNTVLVLATAIVPLPLLLRGEPYYLVSATVFLTVWVAFFLGIGRVRRRSRALRAVALVAAFVATQALFEPDYGSLLRHLTPMLPLLCFVALARRKLIGREEASWPALPHSRERRPRRH